MRKITITISGDTGQGKTAILGLLYRLLSRFGHMVSIYEEGEQIIVPYFDPNEPNHWQPMDITIKTKQ